MITPIYYDTRRVEHCRKRNLGTNIICLESIESAVVFVDVERDITLFANINIMLD